VIIRGGIVYDPANGIFGEEIDAHDLLVMAGGVDAHSHIAGPK
jgi:formylmethanofuran dehydrogenase subunit A